ncbi:MAG: acyltransferase family protein [Lachnospiraceae bacterium]|nr:acyltransferase family protein [Lachnospiraceae bacterium]
MKNSTSEPKTRLTGPDLTRSIAALFVVSVHFFFNCGYYSTPLNNRTVFFMTAARWLFLCCVPLYMILTGFFKSNKIPDKKHYYSLIPIAIAYFVISVIKCLVGNYYYGKVYGVKETLQALGNYTIAWYVGFYFSLMAIAPFLNKMWHSLKSKREQQILLITLSMITALYPVISLIAVSNLNIIACLGAVLELFSPNYWQMMYPLLYYFIGCYIREHSPKFNKFVLTLIIIATTFINAGISYKYAAGNNFNWNILGAVDCGYNCITVVICSTALFLMFYDIDIHNAFIKSLLQKISSVSLEIYLFSGIMDIIIFDYVKRIYYEMKDYAWLFFILVPLNFVLSFTLSALYKTIYQFISKLLSHRKAVQK